jgi:two-component system nitrogen regulation response regulator GlnG
MITSDDVWIVDDDRAIRWVLERALSKEAFSTRSFEAADAALHALKQTQPAVVITDIRMPGTDGLALLKTLQEQFPQVPVIVMTAYGDLDHAVAAFQGGAFEYMPKPFDVDDAISIVRRAVRKGGEKSSDEPALHASSEVSGIVGSSIAIQQVFKTIGRLSNSHMTVMITGESGSGKELVASALHRHSPRAAMPFIALNTAAIPSELLESELFGHEKGSFTGATGKRIGRFEQADNGTLFLDEIGDMPADLQTRLLRVLADGQFYRVGGTQAVRVDVRVIAATHQNLESLVETGRFREDLFHRLNVIRLELPALRDRVDDIEELSNYFLKNIAVELDTSAKIFSGGAIQIMQNYRWPGNVRQLENVCRRVMVMGSTHEVDVDDLPNEIKAEQSIDEARLGGVSWEEALQRRASEHLEQTDFSPLMPDLVPRFESILMRVALTKASGRRQEAARLLGWGRNTLTRKIKEYALNC